MQKRVQGKRWDDDNNIIIIGGICSISVYLRVYYVHGVDSGARLQLIGFIDSVMRVLWEETPKYVCSWCDDEMISSNRVEIIW